MSNETPDSEIEPEYLNSMVGLGRALHEIFNGEGTPLPEAKIGFFLGVFKIGDEGKFNYISSANREDIKTLLKEMLARFEGQPEVTGHS